MSADIEQYYREYGKKLYLYLMTLCNEPETAEELTQETFYQAIRQLPKFRGDSTVFSWLCGIAKNLWRAELRRRKYHPSAESRAISVAVLQQLHALPEQYKELILLRAAAGLSFRTIGEIFGKTENWARVSYYRARQKLKGDDDL